MNKNLVSLIRIVLLTILYVLLGNARSLQENPFMPGAVIAVAMIVPVLGGILFGPVTGLLVGLLGTVANTLSPAGSVYELFAIIPHALMGLAAGLLKKRLPTPLASFSLLIGHILNAAFFIAAGLLSPLVAFSLPFLEAILFETAIGIVAVLIITTIYRLAVMPQ